MAILKIARLGHPVLLQRAEAVVDPIAPEMRRLVADMVETLEDIGGLGLAAPQVHVSLRLFIWRTAAGGHSALFNPEIQPLGQETDEAWEHEHDHLEGILYPMRMTDLSRLGFVEELAKFNPPKPVDSERQKP